MKTIESVLEKLNAPVKSVYVDLHQKLAAVESPGKVDEHKPKDGISILTITKTCKNCDNTESWGASRYCPNCGYYPPTGQVYPGFEKSNDVEVAEEILHWTQVIPPWGWITGGGSIAIVLVSVFIGVGIKGTSLAETWALTQFGLAACGVIISHAIAYTYSLNKTDEFGMFSLWVKPFKMWKYVYKNLPDSQTEFNFAIWNLTAMIAAPLFISAINFEDITNFYAVRRSSNKGLAEAVQEQMAQGEADGDLEGAMNDFKDKAASNVTSMAGGGKKKEGEKVTSEQLALPTEPDLLETDCVVIGFMLDEQSNPTQLVLATTVNGSLQYVGTASTEKLTLEEINDFKKRTTTLFRPRSLIPAPVNAYWLKPVIAVRVLHKDWTPSRKLIEPMVSELLADLNAEKKPEVKRPAPVK